MATTDGILDRELDAALSTSDERLIKSKLLRLKKDHTDAHGILERLAGGQGGLTEGEERELTEAFGKVGLMSTPRQQILSVFAKATHIADETPHRGAVTRPGRREEIDEDAAVERIDLEAGNPEEIDPAKPAFATDESELKPT